MPTFLLAILDFVCMNWLNIYPSHPFPSSLIPHYTHYSPLLVLDWTNWQLITFISICLINLWFSESEGIIQSQLFPCRCSLFVVYSRECIKCRIQWSRSQQQECHIKRIFEVLLIALYVWIHMFKCITSFIYTSMVKYYHICPGQIGFKYLA